MSQEHTQDLLTTFFSGCETLFRFLEERHGYQYYSGLATYAGGRQVIRPYHHEDVKAPFFAVTRYEKGDEAIEIIFGDHNFSFEVFFCPDRINRFTIDEILIAAKKARLFSEKAKNLNTTEMLSLVMRTSADLFSKHQDGLTNLNEKIIERAVAQRAKRMEQKIRDQFQRNFKLSVKHAARAFAEQNYNMVVMLLMPYEFYLKKADLKKLQVARESLTN